VNLFGRKSRGGILGDGQWGEGQWLTAQWVGAKKKSDPISA